MSGLASGFHLIRPAALLLIPVVIGLWWIWRRRSDPLRGWRKQIDPALLSALVEGQQSGGGWRDGGLLAAWLIAAVAIAGPHVETGTQSLCRGHHTADGCSEGGGLYGHPRSGTLALGTGTSEDRRSRRRTKRTTARPGRLCRLGSSRAAADTGHQRRGTDGGRGQSCDHAQVWRSLGSRACRSRPRAGPRREGGSLVVLADTVDTDPGLLDSVAGNLPYQVQILAIANPDASPSDSLEDAARRLQAKLVPLAIGNGDIEAIVRRAASAPVAQGGEAGERWQEAGYWLLPVLGLIVLASFRRTEKVEASA